MGWAIGKDQSCKWILFPPVKKGMKSMQKLKDLAPKMKEIKISIKMTLQKGICR